MPERSRSKKTPQRRVATVAFTDSQGRLLLQYRRGVAKFGEEWGFFGGSIEAGETPLQAARREIREEMGIEPASLRHFGTYQCRPTPGCLAEEHVFLAKLPDLRRVRIMEGAGMALMTPREAKSLRMLPAYARILRDLDARLGSTPDN